MRQIYGRAFLLIGIDCPEQTRLNNLTNTMDEQEARTLIARNLGEDADWGQQLRRTFHLADAFLSYPTSDEAGTRRIAGDVSRLVKLLFGEGVISPRRDETGMFMAHTASLRSADLSRQVGAAILGSFGDLVSLGCNEVPRPMGGQYWDGDDLDARDYQLRYDSNTKIARAAIKHLLEVLRSAGHVESVDKALRDLHRHSGKMRLLNLTEFGRAVHEEMEAILAVGRKGTPVVGCILFTTTFPCHNCVKHIIDSGIKRIVYIKPYAKSLAGELHGDAIQLRDEAPQKVVLEPFVGIAPRLYETVFSIRTPEGQILRRKCDSGCLTPDPLGIRGAELPVSYIEREAIAANVLKQLVEQLEEGEDK